MHRSGINTILPVKLCRRQTSRVCQTWALGLFPNGKSGIDQDVCLLRSPMLLEPKSLASSWLIRDGGRLYGIGQTSTRSSMTWQWSALRCLIPSDESAAYAFSLQSQFLRRRKGLPALEAKLPPFVAITVDHSPRVQIPRSCAGASPHIGCVIIEMLNHVSYRLRLVFGR